MTHSKGVCLIFCCLELKVNFINRDRNPHLQEIDAKDKDNFWEICAVL